MNRIEEALKRAGLAAAPGVEGAGEAAPALDVFPATAGDTPSVDFPGMEVDTSSVDFLVAAGDAPSVDQLFGEAPPNARTADATPPAAFNHIGRAFREKVVSGHDVAPVPVEQYRRLAAALHHSQSNHGIKVVMVASSLPGEGKTLTATNLALTLSESYKRRVLLMDGDLRRPMLHEVFGVPNVSGLTDGLVGKEDRKLPTVEVSPRLSLLTAGRPARDPMGALISDRMRRLLAEASARFDWVIVDTPPVALLPDANLLAAMVDAAVFVVAAGKTPSALALKSVEAIGRDRVVGVVLNRADDSAVPGGQDYHYYGYYGSTPRTAPGKKGAKAS